MTEWTTPSDVWRRYTLVSVSGTREEKDRRRAVRSKGTDEGSTSPPDTPLISRMLRDDFTQGSASGPARRSGCGCLTGLRIELSLELSEVKNQLALSSKMQMMGGLRNKKMDRC